MLQWWSGGRDPPANCMLPEKWNLARTHWTMQWNDITPWLWVFAQRLKQAWPEQTSIFSPARQKSENTESKDGKSSEVSLRLVQWVIWNQELHFWQNTFSPMIVNKRVCCAENKIGSELLSMKMRCLKTPVFTFGEQYLNHARTASSP